MPKERPLPSRDEQVASYRQAIEIWARDYVGWNMAEQDDLVQEGMIAVWLALEADVIPSKDVVRYRMMDYVRALGKQMGQGEKLSHVPIEFAQQELDNQAYDAWLDVEQG